MLAVLGPGARGGEHASLVAWLRKREPALFLPAVAIAEVASGIAKLRRQGSGSRAAAFQHWLDATRADFGRRILPLDTKAAIVAGELTDLARATGIDPGFADLAIAGIAGANEMTILTRNTRHFVPLGVPVLDPYIEGPG